MPSWRSTLQGSAGLSLPEVLISILLVGISIGSSIELSSVNFHLDSKTRSSIGLRGVEESVLALIEFAGMEVYRNSFCGSAAKNEFINTLKNDSDSFTILKPDEKDLMLLPEVMRERCKNEKNDVSRGITHCFRVLTKDYAEKKPINEYLVPFLKRNTVILEAAYIFKQHPNYPVTCRGKKIKFKDKDTSQILGGDLYYNLAYGPTKQTIAKSSTLVVKRNYRYLRADTGFCYKALTQRDGVDFNLPKQKNACFKVKP